ncbi:hypothetical protein [Geomicrobium sediminis]|uniref:Uncharacterized protein n=1 Tax=Geomicrobium sediminis TaxID=1347788 RepID=A0ABS2P6M2_9BACL|nr:hypothetical protein [Geomicrobium sediminis]MBM7631055.1 hypothetical protein [Geomicrobium sediminis]
MKEDIDYTFEEREEIARLLIQLKETQSYTNARFFYESLRIIRWNALARQNLKKQALLDFYGLIKRYNETKLKIKKTKIEKEIMNLLNTDL